jgi:hypothetical protein
MASQFELHGEAKRGHTELLRDGAEINATD